MRLIDADEFKNQIIAAGALFGASIDKVNAFCKIVDNQPTVQNDSEKLKEFLNRIDKAYEEVPIYPEDGECDKFYGVCQEILCEYDDFIKK